jgi:hypothetical protein
MTSSEYTQYIHAQIDDMRTYDDPAHYGANYTNVEDHGIFTFIDYNLQYNFSSK